MRITRQEIIEDATGCRFQALVAQHRNPVDAVLHIMNEPAARQRMIDAETHHGRPALAGVVRDIEAHPAIRPLLADLRFRQLVGVITMIVMRRIGWTTTGTKGSLAAIANRFRLAEHYAVRK